MRPFATSVMACALISGAALADNPPSTSTAITGAPDATIELSGGAVAAGIGYQWGHGDVVYQGQKHRFSLSGLSIVDVGATSYTASGVVYNLHSLSDLSGHYGAAGAGVTVAGGGSADYLKNEKGVGIKLTSASKGLQFKLSASGVTIKLED